MTTKDIKRGDVAGAIDNDPPRAAESFTAQVIILNHPGKIMEGYTPVLDVHTTHVPCKFEKIEGLANQKANANELPREPMFLKNGDTGIVKLVPLKPLVVEAFKDYPSLGRFAIRDMKKTVAVGVIRSVVKENPIV